MLSLEKKKSLRVCGLVSLTIALIVMVGWMLDLSYLKDLGVAGASMKFNTALGFSLLGLALIGKAYEQKWAVVVLTIFLSLLTLVTLAEYIFGISLGIDQLFVTDQRSVKYPGRMSTGSSAAFLLTAFALTNLTSRRWYLRLKQYGLHLVSFMALLSIVGVAFGLSPNDRLVFISSMALHTAILFFATSICLSSLSQFGLANILMGEKPGNILSRKMFAQMIGTVLIAGYLLTTLESHQFITAKTSTVLIGVISLFFSLIYVGLIAKRLNLSHDIRRYTEKQLQSYNEALESKVAEQTKSMKTTLDRLYDINRVAMVGGWEADLATNKVTWSTTTKRIHEVPEDYQPDLSTAIKFYKEGEDRNAMAKTVNDAISLGLPWDVELRIITSVGKEKWVRAIGKPIFENGKCVRLNGTFQDIDKRKRVEIEATEGREFLQTLIDNIPVNIYAKDIESRKILINKAELSLMGLNDKSLVIGKTDHELFPKASADLSKAEDLQVFSTGEPILGVETSMTLNSGETRWFLTSKIPIKNTEGIITGLLGVSVDITDRKRSEESLKGADTFKTQHQELRDFSSTLSEQLLNPLVSLLKEIETTGGENKEKLVSNVNRLQTAVTTTVKAIEDFTLSIKNTDSGNWRNVK
ncbi:MAG: PAS domain-containing protein [Imperialibacter sp.]|uniref:PAS domain-containing protein n=1 Tax=Imperialibacter sp. TaxID=2038411 RepID=UPI0032EDD4AF